MKRTLNIFLFFIIFIGVFSIPLSDLFAASFYLSPPTGVYEVGESFEVRVMIDPGTYSVNAVEGDINFRDSRVELLDISTENSALGIWTEEPSVSDDGERVSFGGGKTEPFSGNAVSVFTLTLKGRNEGVSQIGFDSGSIMAPDVTGTQNVVSEMVSGSYTFVSSPAEEKIPEPEFMATEGAPDKPVVTSDTHKDEDVWYPDRDISFSWDLPEDVIDVRAELDQKSFMIPQESLGKVDSVEYEDVLDGEWFFHIQFKNEKGWSEVYRRSVLVDSTSPESFELEKVKREDKTDPMVEFSVSAIDEISGIDHFLFSIDGLKEQKFSAFEDKIEFGPISPGVHTIMARAFDKAGNTRLESLIVEVDPIEDVVFTEFSNIIHSGSVMAFRGESIPNAKVVISLQKRGEEPEKYETKTDSEGYFTFVLPKKPTDGIYQVKAKAIDERGAESFYNEAVTVAVQPPGVLRLGEMVIDGLSVFISLLAMIILLVLVIYWSYHKWKLFRGRLSKEIREAEEEVHQTFENLKNKRLYQLSILKEAEKSRDLTEEEIKIKEQIQEDIDDFGESVEKEVHDIKEVFDK